MDEPIGAFLHAQMPCFPDFVIAEALLNLKP
jgi:hypothetical protein